MYSNASFIYSTVAYGSASWACLANCACNTQTTLRLSSLTGHMFPRAESFYRYSTYREPAWLLAFYTL